MRKRALLLMILSLTLIGRSGPPAMAASKEDPCAHYPHKDKQTGVKYEVRPDGSLGLCGRTALFPKVYHRLADEGNATAQLIIALNYRYGRSGFVKDDKESKKWFLKAAAQGNEKARQEFAAMGGNFPGSGRLAQQGIAVFKEGQAIWAKAKTKEDWEKALSKYLQALELFKKSNAEKWQGTTLNNIGLAYHNLGRYQEALDFYDRSLAVHRKVGNVRSEGVALGNIGDTYVRLGQYQKGLEDWEKALEIKRKSGDTKGEGVALNSMGWIYHNLGQQQEALQLYEKALVIHRKVGNALAEANTLKNMGLAYSDMNQHQQALEQCEKALEIYRKAANLQDERIALDYIAASYLNLAQYDKALEYREKALEIRKKLSDPKGEAIALNNIGWIYYNLGQQQKALEYYEKALAINRKCGNTQGEGTTLGNMGLAYANLGQRDKALEAYTKALEIDERALQIQRQDANILSEAQTLSAIGWVYSQLNQDQNARDNYERALAIYQKVGNLQSEANTLAHIGTACRILGQYRMALEHFDKALSIYRKTANSLAEANIQTNIAFAYRELSQYREMREHAEKSLEIAKRIGNHNAEATALMAIGDSYRHVGQNKKAIEYYSEALNLPGKTSNYNIGAILNNMGAAYRAMGEYKKALEKLEKALEIQRSRGSLRDEGVTQDNIGGVYYALGQYRKALECYEKALELNHKTGYLVAEGWSLSHIGGFYQSWGDRQKALGYYEKAVEINKKIGHLSGEASNFSDIGTVHFGFKQYDDALKDYQKALEIKNKIGEPTTSVRALMALTYMEIGDLQKAENCLKEAGSRGELGKREKEKGLDWVFGILHLVRGEYDKAKINYVRLLASAEKSGNPGILFAAYTGLGKVWEGLEDYKKAEEYYEKGMKLTEEIRSSLLPSERKDFFEAKVSGFGRSEPAKGLTRVRMKINQSAKSIDSSEATRARAFSDHIAQGSELGYAGIPKNVLVEEAELVSRLASLRKELADTEKEKNPDRYKNLSKEVGLAEENLTSFVDMLWEKHIAYAAVKYPRPVTLRGSALRPEEYVVMFDVSEEGVGVKLIKGKEIAETYYRKWKLNDLETDVKRFRQPFEEAMLRAFDPDLGKSLYDKLLARVLSDVPQGTPLVIIPDGVLAVLPFEALVTGGKANWKKGPWREYPEGLTYLGDVYPISYYQSITALTLARTGEEKKKNSERLLVIADPVFQLQDARAQSAKLTQVASKESEYYVGLMAAIEDANAGPLFNRLPQTGALAADLSKLYASNHDTYTDLKADKSTFLNTIAPRLDQYSAIVFATHGVFSAKIPGVMEPFLALTMVPYGTDGFLKMSEVMSLKMNADIVALTACQTGLGKELSGEGVMSMGRAFQYAGARSVLMTLWSVAADSSIQLVEDFFKHLKEGKGKLQALQLARKEIRANGFEHPFFWAAFTLVGEAN